MLLILWDIKEKSETKEITNRLRDVENKVRKVVSLPAGKAGCQSSACLPRPTERRSDGPARQVASKNSLSKIIFTDSTKIRRLNKIYWKLDKETDVLSFAELDLDKKFPALREKRGLGEIFINYDWVKRDKNPVSTAAQLFLHGYLHLLGYDHEKDRGEMKKLENKLQKIILHS